MIVEPYPGRVLPAVKSQLVALVLLAQSACSGTSGSGEVHLDTTTKRSAPSWVAAAVDESRFMMENRCPEIAPLDVLWTDDAAFHACMAESTSAAYQAWKAVYDEALKRCVSSRSNVAECCFAKVTDRSEDMDREQVSCSRECAERTGRPPTLGATSRGCRPVNVSPMRRSRSRAHTAAVAEVLRVCGAEANALSRCDELPSVVEREYCRNACQKQRSEFQGALALCIQRVQADQLTPACAVADQEQKASCERLCSSLTRADGGTQ